MARQEVPEYGPTGATALEKISVTHTAGAVPIVPARVDPAGPRVDVAFEQALASSFPGTEHDLQETGGFQVLGSRGAPQLGYNTTVLQPEEFCLVAPQEPDVPFSLAQAVRIVHEQEGGGESYVVYKIWRARRKEHHQNRPNIFGRWSRMPDDPEHPIEPPARRVRVQPREGLRHRLGECLLRDIICWPVRPEFEGRFQALIPFECFDFLYASGIRDCRGAQHVFTDRGRAYVAHLCSLEGMEAQNT